MLILLSKRRSKSIKCKYCSEKKRRNLPKGIGTIFLDDDATRLVTVDNSSILDRWRAIDLLFRTIQHTSTIINCNAGYRVAF